MCWIRTGNIVTASNDTSKSEEFINVPMKTEIIKEPRQGALRMIPTLDFAVKGYMVSINGLREKVGLS